jgi:pimeloyl-ACP methyl ester carboxylesterase
MKATALALYVAASGFGVAAVPKPPPPLSLSSQGSFFIGGHDVHSDTLSNLAHYAPTGTITVEQMYVHYEIPSHTAGHFPITFIHGCCLTGKTWETTPDGRMGWDEYFLRKGYPVYVVDQADRGRSALNTSTISGVKSGKLSPDQLPDLFDSSHEAAWQTFRFGPEYPNLFPGMQFPIEAQAEFWKQMVPDWTPSLPDPNPTIPDLSQLAIRLDGTILISHSQSGVFPFRAAEISSQGIAAIIALEPGSCPDAHADMKPFATIPILVLYGDNVESSPRWGPRLKQCQAFVHAAKQVGVTAELVLLPDIGIHGNSHMLMQDKNNLVVADWILSWIDQHVVPKQDIGKSAHSRFQHP